MARPWLKKEPRATPNKIVRGFKEPRKRKNDKLCFITKFCNKYHNKGDKERIDKIHKNFLLHSLHCIRKGKKYDREKKSYDTIFYIKQVKKI